MSTRIGLMLWFGTLCVVRLKYMMLIFFFSSRRRHTIWALVTGVQTCALPILRFTRSNAPAANLWYTKAATDHLVFHQFQEFFSPGYLRRMKRRARNEFDQEFWWEPGDKVPERAPDLERALGDK